MSEATLKVKVDSSDLKRGKSELGQFTKAGKDTERETSKSMGGVAKSFSVAAKAAAAAAAAIASMGIAASKAARDARPLAAALAETLTLLEGTAAQADELTRASRALTRTYGGNSTQQLKAYYQAISAGASSVAEATTILDQANKLAIGGVTDITTAVDGLTTAMNAYAADGLTAAQASDAMFVGMKAGKTTIGELSASLGNVIPLASAAGVSFEELVAGVAALTTQGQSTSVAVTGLRAIIASVLKPTKEASDAADELGLAFNSQALEAQGLQGFLAQVIKKTGGSKDAMAQLFGGVEALNPVLAFAGGAGATFAEVLEDMGNKAGATDAAFETMNANMDQRWSVATAQLTASWEALGLLLQNFVVPVVEFVSGAMAGLVDAATAVLAPLAALLADTPLLSAAVINTANAMNQEAQQALQLSNRLLEMGEVSYDVLGAKIALIETTLRNIDAIRQENVELAKSEEAYKAASATIIQARDIVKTYQDLVESGRELTPDDLASYNDWLGRLRSAVAIQKQIVDEAGKVGPEYEKAVAELALLQEYLDDANGETVRLGENTNEVVVNLVTAAEMAGFVSDALGLSKTGADALRQALESAAGAAGTLYSNVMSVVSALPVVGSGLGKLADATTTAFGALVSSGLGKFTSSLADAGKTLSLMWPAAVRAGRSLKTDLGGGAKSASKEVDKLASEIERLEFNADPLKKYNAELENLNMLLDAGLSEGAYRHELERMNEELQKQSPIMDDLKGAWKDFVVGGFKDFKDFAKNVLNIFKNMLFDMIFAAKKNPINFTGGISGGGGAVGPVAQAAGGGGGAGGIMGGLGGIGGSFISGAKGVFTAFSGGGGLASVGTYYSSLFAGATSSLSGFAAAAGAVALPLAAVVAAVSFFKKKVKELDRGINVTVDSMDVMIEGYKKINTKRFWGLSSKNTEEAFDGYDEGIGAMVDAARGLQSNIMDAAAAVGIGAEAFEGFTYSFQSSFKDMTNDQIQAELSAKFRQLGHDFAVLIPGLEGLTKEGELASETLFMLVDSMNGVNAAFDVLGFSMLDATLEGAALAQSFVNIFGSMENLNAAATAYYQRFYSEAERTEYATDQMRKAMAELGFVMPTTIAGFRALVEQAERMGDLNLAGQLIAIAPAFAGVIDATTAAYDSAAQDLQATVAREQQATRDHFEKIIGALQDKLTDARERLQNSKAIADALSNSLRSRVFPSVTAQRQSQEQAAAYLASLVGNPITDQDALREALRAVADPSADTYETLEEYRRDFARTTGIIAQLEKSATMTLSADEQAVLALEQQLADAQAQSDEQVDLLQQQLDALLGINDAILSLADAMANFKGAQSAAGSGTATRATRATIPTTQLTDAFGGANTAEMMADASNARAIAGIYADVLNRDADAAGLQFWVEQARSLSIPDIAALIGTSDEKLGLQAPPQFAAGGMHSGGWRIVGENGPELEYTGPSQVVSSSRSSQMLDNRAVVAELQAIKPMLASIARSTGRTAADIDKWDNEGIPGTAFGEVVKTEVA